MDQILARLGLLPDSILHIKGGFGVLVASIVAALLLQHLGLHPLTIGIVLACCAAAVAVEGTQWWDNRLADQAGKPRPHEVSLRDAWHSALPGLLAGVAHEAWLHWTAIRTLIT